jgi:hypothetical protein
LHATVLGIGHEQLRSLHPHALRTSKRGTVHRRRLLQGSEIWLAENQVGRLIDGGGNGVPDKNPVIVAVGQNQNLPVGSDHGWVTEAALGEIGVRRRRKIGLSQHYAGLTHAGIADANRAAAALRRHRRVRGVVDEIGNIAKDQDSIVVWREQPVEIGIHHEQRVVGHRDALHRAQLIGRRTTAVLGGKSGLADRFPGRLPGQEVSRRLLREHRRQRQK